MGRMKEIIIKVDDKFLEVLKAEGMEDQYELIRCKDCKLAVKCYGDVVMVDKYGEEIREPLGMNGYCSMAERKEE